MLLTAPGKGYGPQGSDGNLHPRSRDCLKAQWRYDAPIRIRSERLPDSDPGPEAQNAVHALNVS